MKSNILFLHAFPFTAEMWENQNDYFSKKYNCFSPTLPGFGASSLPDHAITFEYYVDYILQYLEKNNLKKSIWCGLSMGGYLALRLYERAPEFCQGLILSDTKAGADANTAKLKRWDTIKAINNLANDLPKFHETQWNALIGESSQSNFQLKDHFQKLISQSSAKGIIAGLAALATRTDSLSMLTQIKVPTLILVGDEDKVTPLTEAELLHKSIKNSYLTILKKCGHLSNLERPEIFNKELEAFFYKINF